ncbi:MAG TPA: hypothetical protein VJ843_01855 [Candidatus Saccharimonadales bacterium]|nr:hypothetical protein [Candidatus Saccharimonadales bacterium]
MGAQNSTSYSIVWREIVQAQAALLVAIGMQVIVWQINHELLIGPQYIIIPVELALSFLMGFTINMTRSSLRGVHHTLSIVLLALISVANVTSLVLVLRSLIIEHSIVSGTQLLTSAIPIFITNIIVFALWYWEIDSPGLTRKRWSKSDKDFQFIQQDMKQDFPHWKPEFFDYMYLSLTNAVNFAPADTRPLTHAAKMLMGIQSLISVFTLALLIARSVNILGT